MQILTRPLLATSLFVAALVQTASANAPSFASPSFFSTAGPAGSMVMGDFDGDGIPDVAVYGVVYDASFHSSGSVEVLFGNGTGGFKTSSSSFTVANGGQNYGVIAAGDLDGDGKTDLVFADGNTVLVYGWNGTGFSNTRTIDLTASGIAATTVAVGDITGKGHNDIIACDDFGAIGLVLVPNDGKGNLGTPVTFAANGLANYAKPIIADVNGDGFADIVLTGGEFGTNNALMGVLLNQGNGTLGPEVLYDAPAITGNTNSFVSVFTGTVADVDGDGKLDLICACIDKNRTTFDPTNILTVNLGIGDGTFKPGVAFRFDGPQKIYGINAIDAADLNGDGRAEVVTADYADSGFTVTDWSGTGDMLAISGQEHFPALTSSFSSITLGYKPSNGAFTTFNKDTNIDVVLGTTALTTSGAAKLAVFKNKSGAAAVNALPPPKIAIQTPITPGGDIHFNVTEPISTATGVTIHIEWSATPTVDGSWTNLPGGGFLQPGKVAGTYNFGTAGTSSYPIGSNLFFRAVAEADGYTPGVSTKYYGPVTLKLAQLTISVKETSTSDPTGDLQIVHIGDKLNYTFTWVNTGNAPAYNLRVMTRVPNYQDATSDLHVQFPQKALTYNQYGHYTNISGIAYVWWNVANLQPGFEQSVTLTVQTGPFMRLQQQIGLENDYQVYSTTGLPAADATGFSSGAPNVGDDVLGPFALSITPDVTSVAPGGLINYTIRITNFSAGTISNVVIADPVPEFANFVSASFINAKGVAIASPAHSIKVNNKATAINNPLRLIGSYPTNSLPVAVQEFLEANPQVKMPSDHADEVVFYIGTLAKDASVSVKLTVQADFLERGSFTDQEVKNVDYTAFFTDEASQIEQSINEDGEIITPVVGPLANPPMLTLQRGVTAAKLSPGDTFAVAFLAHNDGKSAANDVFIEDSLPAGADGTIPPILVSSFVNPVILDTTSTVQLDSGITFIGGGSSITASKANYFVTLDTNLNLITIHGLHLEPDANVEVTYFMQVRSDTPVPEQLVAGTAFIGAGNGNFATNGVYTTNSTGTNFTVVTNTVPVALPLEIPMAVEGSVSLFTPDQPIPMVKHPMASTDPATTLAQLTAAYKNNANNFTVTAGVQRYILDYENAGNDAASDAHLLFTIPANTELYRATFLSGGKVVNPTAKQSITQPAQLGTGNVIFNIGALKAGSGGACMVEVILLPTGINPTNPRIFPAAPQIYNGAQPKDLPRKLDDPSGGFVLYDGKNVPEVGVVKVVPQTVRKDGLFAIQLGVFDTGDIPVLAGCEVTMQAPAGTQIVGVVDGNGNNLSFTPTSLDIALGPIPAHYAEGLTISLQSTGEANTTISDNSIVLKFPYYGTLIPNPTSIQVADVLAVIPNTTITTISGAQFVTLGEVAVIPLGQFSAGFGEALVCGPSTQFGNSGLESVISQSQTGNLIVRGRAEEIPLVNLPDVGNMDTKTVLKQLATIVGQHGGNIFNGPADNLIKEDGKTLIDNDTDEVAETLDQLVKANVRPVVAANPIALPATATAGPTLVASPGYVTQIKGGALITFGGGVIAIDIASVISNDGGSFSKQDGASSLIGQGTSTIITHDGASLVGNAGGAVVSSLTSGASAQSPAGNMFQAGKVP
ncbi:MAG TPA: FG-GAP-like repeat-containing protein [Verrucomicrobiae bacterium]|jgi:uncharacterized repeat protein (TIGR01451 family)